MRVLFTPEKPPTLNIEEMSHHTLSKPIDFSPLLENNLEGEDESSKME
jgi:hypothetical protein